MPFGQRLGGLLTRFHQAGQRAVACTDVSAANVFAPEVAEGFIRLMQRDNPVVERSAFLIGESAMFALQIERMIKQANNPLRRTFRESSMLLGWLGEMLAPPEHERLRRFLADIGAKKT